MTKNKNIILGKSAKGVFSLPLKVIDRDVACFGSSGSGKTVVCKAMLEEVARSGVPVIAFDPQGDIASLGIHEKENVIKEAGTDLTIRDSYVENVEVAVWTPGSTKGMPLSLNPFRFSDLENLSEEDRINFLSSTAKNIVNLIGYDPDSDEGKSNETLLTIVFDFCVISNNNLQNFSDLISILENIPEKITSGVKSISDDRSISNLIKKLNILTLGSQRLLFQNGTPLDINTLLGKDGSTEKTRISVIYLNSLKSSKEKEFFISEVVQSLYQWMLVNPLKSKNSQVQCAMFIDEIAPYIPPVRIPASKKNLELLFRQGRKYGVSSLIATQSPGDIDYKSIGQFSTIIIGALNTKQDIEKVKKRLESLSPKDTESIIKKLPSLRSGEFIVVSPNAFDAAMTVQVRWLVTEHRVIPENSLKKITPNGLLDYYNKKMTISIKNEKSISEDKKVVLDRKSKDDYVLVVENKIFERDLLSLVKPHLLGRLFKKEKLISTNFKYLPIIKVELTFEQKKGIFKKKILNIDENIYLDYKSFDIFYAENKFFKFSEVVDAAPNEIYDLDNCCDMVVKNKSEVDFDFRMLGGKKLEVKKVKSVVERKYRVKVKNIDLVFFPLWICDIENKKTEDQRKITFDGIFGNQMFSK